MTEPTSTPLGGSDDSEQDAAATAPQRPAPDVDGGAEGPVIRDRRRLDPQTGKVRQAYADAPAPEPAAGADSAEQNHDGQTTSDQNGSAESSELAAAQQLAAERLDDLQRLNAEYVNYRKRVDRDRDLVRETAVGGVLEALLPVLDDVHLARQHGDLEGGPFAAISDKLEATLQRFGLERYGEVGEAFDPTVHEALMHTSAELAEGTTTTTVVQVMQPGYRVKDRVLRPARVAVADPAE